MSCDKKTWTKACSEFKSAYGRDVKSAKEFSVILSMVKCYKSSIYDQIRKYHIVNNTLPSYEQVYGFVQDTLKSGVKSQSYYSGDISWNEANIKGKRKYYVEGYASTTDEDDYFETVTKEGQEDLLDQFRDKIITLDIEHDDWVDENGKVLRKPKTSTLPIGKVIHAELKEKGVWVKVEINDMHPNFKNVWESIKRRFLHSFSIGFWEVEVVRREIAGIARKFISRLHLNNLTLTGNPVNTNATFLPTMKAILKSKEGETMVEENQENNVQEGVEDNTQTEEGSQESGKESSKQETDDKSDDESLIKQVADISVELSQTKAELEKQKNELVEAQKKFESEKAAFTEQKETITKELQGPLSAIKAHKEEIKNLRTEITNLKADIEKPILKAKIEHEDVSLLSNQADSNKSNSSVLGLIN